MGSEEANRDFPDQEQRAAFCYSQWRGVHGSSLHCHTLTVQANYQARVATFMGRRHLVVPVIMMVEGVHNGSRGSTLYTREELAQFPEAWNGRPVSIFHPEDEHGPVSCNHPEILQQQVAGTVFNAWYDDERGAQRAEVWIDEERARSVSPEVLAYITSGRQLEVSTGVFSDDEHVSGNWNGEQYDAIARHLRPDHLALLPGGRGACSWEDGCGVRANEEGGESKVTMKRTKPPVNNDPSQGGGNIKEHPLQANQMGEGYRQIIMDVQRQLDAMDTEDRLHFLEELYDDSIIYRVESRQTGEDKLYRRTYSVGEDGTITFGEDRREVAKRTEYVEVSGQQNFEEGNNDIEEGQGGDADMSVKDKVEKLIQNEATKFTEDDRVWLSNLSECTLDKMVPEEPAAQPAANAEPQAPTKDQAVQVLRESLQTPDQFLQMLPADMQDQFRHGLSLHRERRQELIASITANTQAFTEEELQAKDTAELEKLVSMLPVKVDYSGLGGGAHRPQQFSAPEEVLLPVGVEVQTEQ